VKWAGHLARLGWNKTCTGFGEENCRQEATWITSSQIWR